MGMKLAASTLEPAAREAIAGMLETMIGTSDGEHAVLAVIRKHADVVAQVLDGRHLDAVAGALGDDGENVLRAMVELIAPRSDSREIFRKAAQSARVYDDSMPPRILARAARAQPPVFKAAQPTPVRS